MLGSGGPSYAFAQVRSPAAMITFPVPAASNRTGAFRASSFRLTSPQSYRVFASLKSKGSLTANEATRLGFLGLRQFPAHPADPKHVKSKVPSLHRHYPISSILRTSPQPQIAQPGSRELPVGPDLPIPLPGFPIFRVLS